MLIFPNDTFVVISCSPLPSVAATYVCTTSLWTAGSVSLRLRCPVFMAWPHGVWKRKPADFTQPLLSDLQRHSHSDDTHFMKHEIWSSLFLFASALVFPTAIPHPQTIWGFYHWKMKHANHCHVSFYYKKKNKTPKWTIQTKKHIEGKDKKKIL